MSASKTLSSIQVGISGEYFVAAELSRRGYVASLTIRNTRGIVHDGLTLLYVGIAPKEPPRNGKPPSSQTLRDRLRNHLRGNASGSTLRRTLGCLLGFDLRRTGWKERLTFANDEAALSGWMDTNAFVCWVEDPTP